MPGRLLSKPIDKRIGYIDVRGYPWSPAARRSWGVFRLPDASATLWLTLRRSPRIKGDSEGDLHMKSVRVADYMATQLVTFKPTDTVFDAMYAFLERKISGAPVVDADGALLGILSETDLLEVVIQDSYYNEFNGIVADFMKSPVETVSADDDIYTLAQRFRTEHRRRYPVLRDGRLVGQISRRDVLRAAIDMVQKQKRS
jgi:CBS-domain-containing membrane protein